MCLSKLTGLMVIGICVLGYALSGFSAPKQAPWKVGLRSLGPIQFGMTVQEAERAARLRLKPIETEGAPGCVIFTPEPGLNGGVTFMVANGRIQRVDVTQRGMLTLSGAQVGDPEAQVLQRYAGKLTVAPHKYDETGHYLIFTPTAAQDQKYRVIFETAACVTLTAAALEKLAQDGLPQPVLDSLKSLQDQPMCASRWEEMFRGKIGSQQARQYQSAILKRAAISQRVTRFRAGLLPEVEFVEGCL